MAKLSKSSFLLNLALMFDALEELQSELSEALEADSINLHKTHRLITRSVEGFVSRKSQGGESGCLFISWCANFKEYGNLRQGNK